MASYGNGWHPKAMDCILPTAHTLYIRTVSTADSYRFRVRLRAPNALNVAPSSESSSTTTAGSVFRFVPSTLDV